MGRNKDIYLAWMNMKYRCYNPNHKAFKYYGAKGVKMCNDWKYSYDNFEDWAIKNGWKKGLQVDRFPNKNGNYEPSNCRIVTREVNLQNQGRHGTPEVLTMEQAGQIRELFTSKKSTAKELSEKFNASLSVIYRVLRNATYKQRTMTPEQQRIQDLEQGILRFKSHLEEYGGNYTQDELWRLINLATVDRPYFPPVSYHDNLSGKETSTEND